MTFKVSKFSLHKGSAVSIWLYLDLISVSREHLSFWSKEKFKVGTKGLFNKAVAGSSICQCEQYIVER